MWFIVSDLINKKISLFPWTFTLEISHLNMAGDAEQTDSSGKYTFGGGAATAKKYWPTIMKSIELVSFVLLFFFFFTYFYSFCLFPFLCLALACFACNHEIQSILHNGIDGVLFFEFSFRNCPLFNEMRIHCASDLYICSFRGQISISLARTSNHSVFFLMNVIHNR